MTVRELIAELQQHPDDAQVHVATQPNYPMDHEVGAVAADCDGTVYVAVGLQVGYLPGDAAEHLGWHESLDPHAHR